MHVLRHTKGTVVQQNMNERFPQWKMQAFGKIHFTSLLRVISEINVFNLQDLPSETKNLRRKEKKSVGFWWQNSESDCRLHLSLYAIFFFGNEQWLLGAKNPIWHQREKEKPGQFLSFVAGKGIHLIQHCFHLFQLKTVWSSPIYTGDKWTWNNFYLVQVF